jgi:hypothetical protein
MRMEKIGVLVDPRREWYEFYYTLDEMAEKVKNLPKDVIEKLKQFENEYFFKEDLPLGYIMVWDKNENIIDVYAVAFHTGEYGPEIYLVNVYEWLRSRDDP